MNYKKLFNGALILFASILIAISCSSPSGPSNDNELPSDNDDTNNNTSTNKTELNINLGSIESISTTDKYFKINTKGQPVNFYHQLNLTLSGNDSYEVASVDIKSITGLNKTEATKAMNGGLRNKITTAVDLSNTSVLPAMITPSVSGIKLTLKAAQNIGLYIKDKINQDGYGGVIKVVLTANPKDTTKYTKKELTIYIGLIGTGTTAQ